MMHRARVFEQQMFGLHAAVCVSCYAAVPADNTVRLSNGSLGALEIYHNGAWGTLCDVNDEDDNVCSAACRQLGY